MQRMKRGKNTAREMTGAQIFRGVNMTNHRGNVLPTRSNTFREQRERERERESEGKVKSYVCYCMFEV